MIGDKSQIIGVHISTLGEDLRFAEPMKSDTSGQLG